MLLAEVEEVDGCTEVAGGEDTGEPEGNAAFASGFLGVLADAPELDVAGLRSDVELPLVVLVSERFFEDFPPIVEEVYDCAARRTNVRGRLGLPRGRRSAVYWGARRLFYTERRRIRRQVS